VLLLLLLLLLLVPWHGVAQCKINVCACSCTISYVGPQNALLLLPLHSVRKKNNQNKDDDDGKL